LTIPLCTVMANVRLQKTTPLSKQSWSCEGVLFCLADKRGAFVQPAIYEAFGLTVVEAMSCGLPTFATICGGPAEVSHFWPSLCIVASIPHSINSSAMSLPENSYL
jgi:hypothetical protein